MKNIVRSILALCLCLALCSVSRANLDIVTSLSTSTVSTIVAPGPHCWFVIIQNLGTNAVNVTLDGGTTYTDMAGYHGTDPTTGSTGKGYQIPPASSGVPGYLYVTAQPNTGLLLPIRAIMQTGTTTLSIVTSDTLSTFPTP